MVVAVVAFATQRQEEVAGAQGAGIGADAGHRHRATLGSMSTATLGNRPAAWLSLLPFLAAVVVVAVLGGMAELKGHELEA